MTRHRPRHGQRQPTIHARLTAYGLHHLQAAALSFAKLYRNPVASGLTVLAIGAALALPVALMVFLDNVDRLTGGWDRTPQISVFMAGDLDQTELDQTARSVQSWPEVGYVKTISPAQALAEFVAYSGLGEALTALDENPLPPVLVVTPALAARDADLRTLADRLATLPGSERISIDLDWLRRLQVITALLHRLVWIIFVLLAAMAFLVVGNTIRLDVEGRREEIEVIRLVGGTDAFIRRPFLYGGMWYGLGGGLLATMVVWIGLIWLKPLMVELNILYQTDFTLQGLELARFLLVLSMGWGLGLLGAWFAVGRYLHRVESR